MPQKPLPSRRFAIAVSFPGEHRRFVLKVVERLADLLGPERVFYDEWYEAELVGLDGDLKLRRYYREASDVVVPFFSKHHAKDWCQIEWSAIRAMLEDRRREDAVIPVSLDPTKVEGWEDIDFAIRKGARTGEQIADLIFEAYRLRHPKKLGKSAPAARAPQPSGSPRKPAPKRSGIGFDISRILKYAPAELIGRDDELQMLHAVWSGIPHSALRIPHF